MHIAYISYEHPAGIAAGGIGTYVDQIATMMATRDHYVEVFSATKNQSYTLIDFNNYKLHLIPVLSQNEFREAVVNIFSESHQQNKFDLIESGEFGADALSIKKLHPSVPLLVKLHTPTFFVKKLNSVNPSLVAKLRFILGGLKRGKIAKAYWKNEIINDPEREIYNLADGVSSPSKSLAQVVKIEWGERDITILPYPFQAINDSQPIQKPNGNMINVLFIGRLEQRKGIYEIAKAIPQILKQNPAIAFHFAGADQPSIFKNLSVKEYLKKHLKPFTSSLHFYGVLNQQQLLEKTNEADICLFPSLWENFPNVCLESMIAGKAVIGTNNGGMAEMISHRKSGYLISPGSPEEITKGVLELAANKAFRQSLSSAARETVLLNYNPSVIGAQTENFYNNILIKTNR